MFSNLSGEYFSLWPASKDEDRLRAGGLGVGDRQSYRNQAKQKYEQGRADQKYEMEAFQQGKTFLLSRLLGYSGSDFPLMIAL